jgi:RNA polymerase sigma-70 factor (ECF subfamily)
MVTGSRVNDQRLAELMSAYQQGDIHAFEGLYWNLRPRLQQYLSILTRSRSRAEDLLQETFLQIHRSRATYWPGHPVVPWALAIARHVYLMDVRKRTRLQAREIAVDDPPEMPVPPEVERLAEQERLQQALNQLPTDQREAVILHHVWGFTFAEIGATLGVRAITAKVRAFRGLRALRTMLGADV